MDDKKSAIIFMHGLGDSPAGWSQLEHSLELSVPVIWRFPAAPMAPVSINGGQQCTSWFDIVDWPIGLAARDDREGMAASVERTKQVIQDLVQNEKIDPKRIVVGGFSQGGAVALQAGFNSPHKIGGIVCLSGWLFHRDEFAVGANGSTPVFWGHGQNDEVVLWEQQKAGTEILVSKGVPVTSKTYRMGHSSHPQEMSDLADFLSTILQ